MSVPTVLSYVTSIRVILTVHVWLVIFWMKMEEHVMVCHYVSYVTNDVSNIQLHGTCELMFAYQN